MKKLLGCVVCLCALLGYTNISYGAEQDKFQRTFELAKNGDAEAQYILGEMYWKGEGVPQDDKKSAEWFEKAAAQGKASAQLNLGMMYEYGKGVQQDKSVAKEWFGKACDNGREGGCKNYARLNEAGY